MSAVVVDTSALVAILRQESNDLWLLDQLQSASPRLMAAPNALELGIVLEARSGPPATGISQRALRDAQIQVEPFDADLAERALAAWRRFGKGRHPAALNFGDCCTYALAELTGHPILHLGDDFTRTDLQTLQPPPP